MSKSPTGSAPGHAKEAIPAGLLEALAQRQVEFKRRTATMQHDLSIFESMADPNVRGFFEDRKSASVAAMQASIERRSDRIVKAVPTDYAGLSEVLRTHLKAEAAGGVTIRPRGGEVSTPSGLTSGDTPVFEQFTVRNDADMYQHALCRIRGGISDYYEDLPFSLSSPPDGTLLMGLCRPEGHTVMQSVAYEFPFVPWVDGPHLLSTVVAAWGRYGLFSDAGNLARTHAGLSVSAQFSSSGQKLWGPHRKVELFARSGENIDEGGLFSDVQYLDGVCRLEAGRPLTLWVDCLVKTWAGGDNTHAFIDMTDNESNQGAFGCLGIAVTPLRTIPNPLL